MIADIKPKKKIRQFANATAAYHSVEPILHRHVLYYVKRCGGDYAEMMAEANYAFVLAWNTWDKEHQLTTWVWHAVHGRLLCYLKERQRPNRLGSRQRIRTELTRLADPNRQRGIATLLEGLSKQSRLAAEEALSIHLASKGISKRRALLKMLIEDLGWTGQQVLDVFREIREALR